jgi:diguanylate cyclase (GGDEF)-like protein
MGKISCFFISLFALLLISLSLNASLDTLFAEYNRMVTDERAEFLLNRGIGYFNLNDYQKALEYLKIAQNKFNKTGNSEGISKCLNNLGNVYNNLGQYEKALEYHLHSLEIEQEIQNKNGITRSLNNIGNVYQNTGNLEKALEFYLKSLELTYETNDKSSISKSLNNVGNIHLSQGDFDRALEYYTRSLKIKQSIQDKFGTANSYNNIGIAYQGLHQPARALEYYQKSLQLMKEIYDKHGIASALYHSGILYFELQNLKKALSTLQEALQCAEQINDRNIVMSCYRTIAEIFSQKGEYNKAYKFYKLYAQTKDELISEESSKAIIEMRVKYETKGKEREIELLKQNVALKAIESRRQTLFMIIITIGFVFFAITAFFVYNQLRLKAYSNKIIAEQNEKLKKAYKKVEELASIDSLTGLSNRRDILKKIRHEANRFDRNKKPFALIMGDIDDFKSVNDTYGHDAGDMVLQAIANFIKTNIRKQDTVGRWGGEEFLVLLPDTDLKGAKFIAEKLREGIFSHTIQYSNYDLKVTITFGVAVYKKLRDINECIKEADQALYLGKVRKKNCVVSSDELK